MTPKKVWGIIIIILGILMFFIGIATFYYVDMYDDTMEALGGRDFVAKISGEKAVQLIEKTYNEERTHGVIRLFLGIAMAIVGTLLLRKDKKLILKRSKAIHKSPRNIDFYENDFIGT